MLDVIWLVQRRKASIGWLAIFVPGMYQYLVLQSLVLLGVVIQQVIHIPFRRIRTFFSVEDAYNLVLLPPRQN